MATSKENSQTKRLRQALFEELETRTFEDIPTAVLLKMISTLATVESKASTRPKSEKPVEQMTLEEMREHMKNL